MVNAAVVAMLSQVPGLAALIGTRIYPGVAPQTVARPYLTYQLITARSVRNLLGVSNCRKAVYQLDAWSNTNLEAETISDLIYQFFRNGFQGPVGGVTVKWVWHEPERDAFISLQVQATDTGIQRSSSELTVWYGV